MTGKEEIKVYAARKKEGLRSTIGSSLRDLRSSAFLARQLAVRDIKAQYRQSYLGILWAFITPVTTAIVWIFLQSTGTVRLSDTGMAYPVYAFSGTLIWSIITEAINSPVQSTNASRSIISKINFPKEALLLSGIYKMMFNAVPKILLLVLLLIIFKVEFKPFIFLFPLFLLGAIFFGFSLGLLITPISLLYTDISKLVSIGLRFLMYITPVVYAIPDDGIMKVIMDYNPFTAIILTTRASIDGVFSHLPSYFVVLACCIPLFLVALAFYRVSIPIIVERSNA